jgi:L-aminopeptidase/D-esterase-like protein
VFPSEAENTDRNSDPDVLDEDDALEFNDDKVDQLFQIIGESFERFLADCVVLARTHLGREAITQHEFSSAFSKSGDYLPSALISV